jgi:type I restriction-modification system DNA methylase subunit
MNQAVHNKLVGKEINDETYAICKSDRLTCELELDFEKLFRKYRKR